MFHEVQVNIGFDLHVHSNRRVYWRVYVAVTPDIDLDSIPFGLNNILFVNLQA